MREAALPPSRQTLADTADLERLRSRLERLQHAREEEASRLNDLAAQARDCGMSVNETVRFLGAISQLEGKLIKIENDIHETLQSLMCILETGKTD